MPEQELKWAVALIEQLECLKYTGAAVTGDLLYSWSDCAEARRRLTSASPAIASVLERRILALERALEGFS